VLTEDVKFLEPADRERVLDGQREVVNAFAEAIAESRPELRTTELHKPVTMLLFGMMNWMFTWLRPHGALGHAELAPVVADLFFGGLDAVRAPAPKPTHSHYRNGDLACPSSDAPPSRPASARRARSAISRRPPSTSA
jgi:TetR/AcrR family transcriptional regulator